MIIKPENITKKMDSMGRVIIPTGIRSRMGLEPGQELSVYILEDNGVEYICYTNSQNNAEAEIAVKILEKLGVPIPKELEEKRS